MEFAAGVVETPVFFDAEVGVALAFVGVVVFGGGFGGYFQDEFGGLADFVDYVAVAGFDGAGSTPKATITSGTVQS